MRTKNRIAKDMNGYFFTLLLSYIDDVVENPTSEKESFKKYNEQWLAYAIKHRLDKTWFKKHVDLYHERTKFKQGNLLTKIAFYVNKFFRKIFALD